MAMTFAVQLLFLFLQFVTFVLIGAAAGAVVILNTPPRWAVWTLILIGGASAFWIGVYGSLFAKGPL